MCSSTTFALRHMQISLSGILWHFRPPSRHLLLNTHDTNMEFRQLNGPPLDIFLFFSKTKIFHSHPCKLWLGVTWSAGKGCAPFVWTAWCWPQHGVWFMQFGVDVCLASISVTQPGHVDGTKAVLLYEAWWKETVVKVSKTGHLQGEQDGSLARWARRVTCKVSKTGHLQGEQDGSLACCLAEARLWSLLTWEGGRERWGVRLLGGTPQAGAHWSGGKCLLCAHFWPAVGIGPVPFN